MQEATAIDDTRLFFGKKWMRFFDAVGTNIALFRLDALRPWGNQPRPQTHQYHFLRARDVQSLRRREGTITSLEVLQEFRGLLASDPRDIIYASVNLANDKAAKGLVPDYEKPVSEVYREVAVSHIRNMPDPLQIFGSCGTPFSNQDIQPRFASWIPRWKYLLPEMELPKYTTLDDGTKSRLYDVCGPSQSSHSGFGDHSQSIEFHGLALHVRRFAIDTLTSRSTSCLEFETDEISSEVSGWVPPDAAAPYVTGQGQTRMEAFLRTLVADTTLEMPPRRGGQAVWSNNNTLCSRH